MSSRIFFYGLYMDSVLLESMGFQPEIIGAAKLDNYQIIIGDRATLVRAPGQISYGFLLDLTEEDASNLYSRPEVNGYVPERVEATLLTDSSLHPALCYVLSSVKLGADTNAEYAVKLSALVTELGLPSDYAKEIARIGGAT